METHSVPQHIQSYEFRLVGDMTLKQFTWLALGLIISFIIYNLPVYGFIKWPFILTFALLGVAMAFVPYEERPLATWIVAFFKAIYSPTQYVWKKESHPPQILVEPLNLRPLPATEVTGQLTNQQKLQEYLKTIPSQQATGAIITQEAEVQKIDQLFQSVSLPQNFVPDVSPLPEPVEEPSVVPHPLHPREEPLPEVPPPPNCPPRADPGDPPRPIRIISLPSSSHQRCHFLHQDSHSCYAYRLQHRCRHGLNQ